MSQTSASRFIDFDGQPSARTGAAGALSAIVYRSRAVQPLSGTELHWLTQIAQSRNRAECITGVIVYDDECFYQWLEGPRDALARVMASIRNDKRHTDIEILDEHSAMFRHFGGWAMKLATHGPRAAPWQLDAIEAPAAIMHGLHRHPRAAPSLLVALSPGAEEARPAARAEAPHYAQSNHPVVPVLQDVIHAEVIPRLLSHYRQGHPAQTEAARAAELARLLVATDGTAAQEWLASRRRAGTPDEWVLTMIEPAARALGDLWLDDTCSEFDVAIGLARLQTAARLLGAETLPHMSGMAAPPTVLVVPEPGERHLLNAALDSDALWHAGWAPQCAFPSSDTALQDLVDDTWFDALDLSLSPAFRRDHWLPRVSATIAKARRASRNPGLVIVVSGRVFAESGEAGAQVGADATSRTAFHVDELILRGLSAVH
jgi:hypothetical protein